MAFQSVPQSVQIVVEGRADNQLTINDLYFQNSGAVVVTNMSALANAVSAWVTGVLAPLLSRDWTFTRIRAIDLTTQTGPVVEFTVETVGGVDSEAAPNNVSACVSFRTDQRGRSARGRNYVPGIPNSLITLNTLDAGFIGDLVDAYLQLVGPGVFLVGWQQVIVSRVTAGAPRAEGLAIPVTNVLMVGNSVRSMRSREIGHGA